MSYTLYRPVAPSRARELKLKKETLIKEGHCVAPSRARELKPLGHGWNASRRRVAPSRARELKRRVRERADRAERRALTGA